MSHNNYQGNFTQVTEEVNVKITDRNPVAFVTDRGFDVSNITYDKVNINDAEVSISLL